jgi:D-erythro-7,8-dihydroneopterin triphosphate epimerase
MKELDKIYIRDLLVRCIIGIFENERKEKQDVIINITLFADFGKACKSDDINDAIDYKVIKKNIIAFVESSSFLLLEKLAEGIAKICLDNDNVKKVIVSIDKPGALRFARSVAVEITRLQK